MPPPPQRLPLLLSLVILLGVGGRCLRGQQHGGDRTPSAQPALDSQLARVQGSSDRGTARAKRPSTRSRTRVREQGAESLSPAEEPGEAARVAPRVRQERTPVGALSPDGVARHRSDLERLQSGARAPASGTTRRARRATRPRSARPNTGEAWPLVDVETATAAELQRLPRVGPSLARRIVEDRRRRGAFRTLEGLQRVRGVGPALARGLEGYVTFGRTGRP